jgi:predicted transposase YdaD
MILLWTIEREFWQELQAFEEERKVTYVTNAERFGFERRIEQGIEQGVTQEARSLILRLLSRRIGTMAPSIESQIATLSVSQLEPLGEALLDFSTAADLDEWLRSR